MDVSASTREIAYLFNFEGTEYTLFESGEFTTPRSISDLRVRNRHSVVAIQFDAVGAALRLHPICTDGSEGCLECRT